MEDTTNSETETDTNEQTSKGGDADRRRVLKGAGMIAGGAALAGIGSQSVAANHLTIPMGEDITFTNMNRDRRGQKIDDTLDLFRGGSRSESDHDQAWATAEADAGEGTARFFGSVGRKFVPEGETAQEAVVSMQGNINGYLEGALEGSAQVVVILSLVDFTEGTAERARPRARLERSGVLGSEQVDTLVQNTLETTLRPDHTYIAWANLHARVDLGLADPDNTVRSDFGGDHEGLEVDEIKITFRN